MERMANFNFSEGDLERLMVSDREWNRSYYISVFRILKQLS